MIDVSDFVELAEIDPIYYRATYWLAPNGEPARKPYALLRMAMEDQERVGIGSVVMRNKQYLAAIRPLDGVLAMSTMRFADEVTARTEIDAMPKPRTAGKSKELRLAVQIIGSLSAPWRPKRYHDTYTETLRDIIERKAKGEDIVVEEEAAGATAEVVDLMAALEASVKKAKQRRSPAKTKRSA
jgi:DNA end-binding protein Ku